MVAVWCSLLALACGGGGGGGGGTNPPPAPLRGSVVTATRPQAAGAACPNGGILVDAGIDDNGNGLLDAAEVDVTQSVCNGADGTNGLNALALVSPEPAGANCAAGGKKVSVGLDLDRDGVLDDAEVTSSGYVCDGATVAGDDGVSPWLTAEGIDVQVTGLTISAAGATVDFTLDDTPGAGGKPLDRAGLLTEGTVAVRFALAQLSVDASGDPGSYVAYTTRTIAGGFTQATTEGFGIFETVDVLAGRYRYTFATLPVGLDPARTQTVVAVATRTLAGVSRHARAQASVRPDGAAPPLLRSVVEGARCASCHGELTAHGGRFAAVEQCVVCHTPQTSDSAGTPLDFRVMVHKIHRGADLPSVVAGRPYQLRDVSGSVQDYSLGRYPQSIERCDGCHGGAQGDSWKTRPEAAACTSCHDEVVFEAPTRAGEVQHAYGVTASSTCTVCHGATSGISPVVGSHVDPSFDASRTLELAIEPMSAIPPGTAPSFTFTVLVDGLPRNILAAPLASLRATLAGPNGDFTTSWTVGTATNPYAQATIQGSGATGTLVALDAASGRFGYTFPATITVPVSATGSFTVGLEGALSGFPLRFPATAPMRAFAVTDATAVPRRAVIDPARCNACHFDLTAHGGGRRGAAYCVMCHNPENANNDRIARFEGSTVLAESVDFGVMIHRIHMGERLTQPYALGGNPSPSVTNPAGTTLRFDGVRFPGSLTRCETCHLAGTWTLQGAVGRAPRILQELTCGEPAGNDTDSYCTSPFWTVTGTVQLAPETAACTGCHDAPHVLAHAQLNTAVSGVEACATCHGPGKLYDVDSVHAP